MDETGCIFIWGFPLFQGISWVYVKNSLGSYAGKCRWCMGSGVYWVHMLCGFYGVSGVWGSKGCCNVGDMWTQFRVREESTGNILYC